MRKVMIVLGVALVFCGALASCKKKSEEEQIGELVEKLSEAKTLEETERIGKKIEKLEERAEKKSIKEVRVKLGDVLVQRETDILHLRLREYLAFGKEVFLGIREFWITISRKCAGRPV